MANGGHFKKGIRYEIFIGIRDKDSYEEVLSVEDFQEMLTDICTEKEISFSLVTQLGGYTHGRGYTTETSLRVIVIGIDEEEVTLLGDRLKEAVNTDTILVTETEIEYAFI